MEKKLIMALWFIFVQTGYVHKIIQKINIGEVNKVQILENFEYHTKKFRFILLTINSY